MTHNLQSVSAHTHFFNTYNIHTICLKRQSALLWCYWAPVVTEGVGMRLKRQLPRACKGIWSGPCEFFPVNRNSVLPGQPSALGGVAFPPWVTAQLPLLWQSDNLLSLQVQRSGGMQDQIGENGSWQGIFRFSKGRSSFQPDVSSGFIIFPLWENQKRSFGEVLSSSSSVEPLWNIYEFSDNIKPSFLCSSVFPSCALQRCSSFH